MASPQLLDLYFDGSLNYLRHAEAFEVLDFSFFSNNSPAGYCLTPIIINPHTKDIIVDLQIFVQTT